MKNIRQLIRLDLQRHLMYLIVPIVAALILGSMYSHTYVDNIPMGVVDLDGSSLSRSITQQFSIHPGFKLTSYPASETEAREEILAGEIKGAVIIPPDFYKDVLRTESPKVLILVDGSNLLIGNNIQGYSSNILNTLGTGFQLNVLQGKGVLPEVSQKVLETFSFTERILYDPQLSYLRYLYYGVVVFVMQIMFLKTLVNILLTKKPVLADVNLETSEKKAEVREIAARILLNITTVVVGSALALWFTGAYFAIPLRASLPEYIALMGGFMLALVGPAFLFASLLNRFEHFCECLSFTNIIIFYTAGLAWPLYMMPGHLVAAVKCLWPMIYVLMPFKALNVKGIGWDVILPDLQGLLLYILFWLPVGIYIYAKKVKDAKTASPLTETI